MELASVGETTFTLHNPCLALTLSRRHIGEPLARLSRYCSSEKKAALCRAATVFRTNGLRDIGLLTDFGAVVRWSNYGLKSIPSPEVFVDLLPDSLTTLMTTANERKRWRSTNHLLAHYRLPEQGIPLPID